MHPLKYNMNAAPTVLFSPQFSVTAAFMIHYWLED